VLGQLRTQVLTVIVPIILSGGAGSRLWPVSTHEKPKQFHALGGKATMFAQTLQRVSQGDGIAFAPPIIVCGAYHESPVMDELAQFGHKSATLILEPLARNTAPALAAAALVQCERDPDALLLVLPADHVITHPNELHNACLAAAKSAQDGKIVLFAIVPDSPATGYGYIKRGGAIATNVYDVAAFVEKPDLATAQTYVASGDYAWNAGIFFFKAAALVSQLELHAPDVLAAARLAVTKSVRGGDVIRLDHDAFASAPAKSIDYAVLELTEHAAVVPVDMGWNDVGSFATLWDIGDKDEAANVVSGNAALLDSHNCLVRAGDVPVALIGVSDLVVIVTETGILIAPRDRAQDVRLAADYFKQKA
jgi:mannose-1-phosphate guanylyltransferase / mannose-6-phosphate isomerase